MGDPERLHDELRADGRPHRRASPRTEPDRANRDDEAALSRLRDPDALDARSRPAPTTQRGSASSRAGSSTARSATGPARSGSSAWASPASPTTPSSSSPSSAFGFGLGFAFGPTRTIFGDDDVVRVPGRVGEELAVRRVDVAPHRGRERRLAVVVDDRLAGRERRVDRLLERRRRDGHERRRLAHDAAVLRRAVQRDDERGRADERPQEQPVLRVVART